MRISLIGFMGSGKTTIGKKLAGQLKIPFIDLDSFIEKKMQLTISEIFKEKGEVFFRTLEHKSLQEVFEQEGDFVLSVGGGTPCFHHNLQIINQHSQSFYINLPPKALFKRLANAKSERPLISSMNHNDLHEYIKSKLEDREVFYKKAHYTVDGLNQPVQTILKITES